MFVVHLRDGKTLKEAEGIDWKQVPLQDITSLQLHRNGITYTVSADGSRVRLLQLKRNTLDMLRGTNDVTERVIGFIYQDRLAVKMELNERSGNVRVTVEEKNEKARGWHRI